MKNQELKAALVRVLSYCSQTVSYHTGSFYLFAESLEDTHNVILWKFGGDWRLAVDYSNSGGLELYTMEGYGSGLYTKENGIDLTSNFEDPFNPGDEELDLFRFLFPRDSDIIIAAGKEILKIKAPYE